MQLTPINLGEQIRNKVDVHLMQIGVLSTNFSAFMDNEYQKQQGDIVKKNLRTLRITKNKNIGNIIIFPELSVPNSLKIDLQDFAKRKKAFIIAGFFYNEQCQNCCYIFDPKGKIHKQYKLNPAPDENNEVHRAHEQLKKEIKVFVSTPVGDFAVLVCYDFTDTSLLMELRGKIDHLIIITMNKSVERFDTDAISSARNNYHHIFLCNTAKYGWSAIYGPFIRNPKVLYIGPGESSNSKEINLGEFRQAINNPVDYKNKRDVSGYSSLPSNYKRDYEWWRKEPSVLLDDIFIDWENLRDNLVTGSKETIDRFNRNKDNFERSIAVAEQYLKSDAYPQPIIQLEYLLEDLKREFEVMSALKQFTKSSGVFRTGGNKFTDLEDIEYDFLPWDSFLSKFHLKEDEITNFLSEVATYCVKSCDGYPDVKRGYNVVSRRADETNEIILITRTNVDKRKIRSDDVVLMVHNSIEKKKDREIVHYWYTNTSNDDNIRPSQETHLNYEIHKSVPRAKTILHFHHDNILELAWSMPLVYGDKMEQYDVLRIQGHPVPTLLGRNVKIKDLANRLAKKFQENDQIYCIIGVRHGAWAIAEDFETCLEETRIVEKQAGINKSPNMGQEFLTSIKKDFGRIQEQWAKT